MKRAGESQDRRWSSECVMKRRFMVTVLVLCVIVAGVVVMTTRSASTHRAVSSVAAHCVDTLTAWELHVESVVHGGGNPFSTLGASEPWNGRYNEARLQIRENATIYLERLGAQRSFAPDYGAQCRSLLAKGVPADSIPLP